MSKEHQSNEEILLRSKLKSDPADWEARRQLANLLYDRDAFRDAAEIIWSADEIPSTDLDLAFAARILAKSQPRKAIRLLTAILELNRGKAVQNMGMANALLHHGMVLQAARFYGAALDADPTMVNPDLEHFVLWSDDEMTMWGDFKERRPKLGELPWMARDPMEALKLTQRVTMHTTPIALPGLPPVSAEQLKNDMYEQEQARNAKITPPPAVTIPIDRVDPKHRLFDSTYGAAVTVETNHEAPVPAEPKPKAPIEVIPWEPPSKRAAAAAAQAPVPPVVHPPSPPAAAVPAVAAAAPAVPVAVGPPTSALPPAPTPISVIHPPTRPMVHGSESAVPTAPAPVVAPASSLPPVPTQPMQVSRPTLPGGAVPPPPPGVVRPMLPGTASAGPATSVLSPAPAVGLPPTPTRQLLAPALMGGMKPAASPSAQTGEVLS